MADYLRKQCGKLIIAALFLFLFFVTNVYSQTTEFSLPNGLKFIITEDHKAPIATFQIWYRVGSRNEPEGKSGISHLLEHMMFKGSKNFPPKSFSRIVQRNGGIDNAFTTKDYTMYYETLPSDRIELSFQLESDRMKNLLLKTEDVIYERSVVMEERRMRYEDDPQMSLYEEVVATAFKVYPYHNPVIGWMSEIQSISRDDLYRHYRNYYCSKNSFVVLSGDVDPKKVKELAIRYFSDAPECEEIQKVSSIEPEQHGQKRVFLKKQAELPYLLIAYHVPTYPNEDAPALDILSSILSGESGRLYRSIVRDKEIAISVFASYDSLSIDPFLFFLGGTVKPGKSVEELEKALYEEIERIKETLPTEREIQKAINQTEASLIMGLDSIFFQAELIGMFEIKGNWRMKDQYLDALRSVRAEDVQRVARKYLTEDNRVVGILIPLKVKK